VTATELQPVKLATAKKPRLAFLDWTRGMAAIIMLQGHVFHSFARTDLREGGAYRLGMHNPEADMTMVVAGEYREIDPPSRLVYTWSWEGPEGDHAAETTLVAVDFITDGEGTRVEILHTGFLTDDSREQHDQGWAGVLANLERILA